MPLLTWMQQLHVSVGALAAAEPARLVTAAGELVRCRSVGTVPDSAHPLPEPPPGLPLPEAVLAISTLLSERRPGRLQSGGFFTPAAIADLLLQRAGWRSGLTLLDPACGGGVFLLTAARQIQTDDPLSRLATLQKSLHGIEKDPLMASICRLVMSAWVLEPGGNPEPPGIWDILNQNILCDDALLGASWRGKGFDIVAGNPPFLGTRRGRIPQAETEALKKCYHTATGQFDLYSVFVEDGLSRVKDGGTIAFVLPRPFLTNDNCAALRTLLFQYSNHCDIIDLGRPFKASVETVGLAVRKESRPEPVTASGFPGLLFCSDNHRQAGLIQRLSATMPSLGDLADSWRGLECGQHDSAVFETPPGFPLLRGRNVRRYYISPAECYFRPRPGLQVPGHKPPAAKILVRRVSPCLVAAYDQSQSLALNTLYYVVPREGIDPWLLLAVLNSSLIRLWFKIAFVFEETLFPYVRLSQLRKLPCCPPGHKLAPALSELAFKRTSEPSEGKCVELEKEIDKIIMEVFEYTIVP